MCVYELGIREGKEWRPVRTYAKLYEMPANELYLPQSINHFCHLLYIKLFNYYVSITPIF